MLPLRSSGFPNYSANLRFLLLKITVFALSVRLAGLVCLLLYRTLIRLPSPVFST